MSKDRREGPSIDKRALTLAAALLLAAFAGCSAIGGQDPVTSPPDTEPSLIQTPDTEPEPSDPPPRGAESPTPDAETPPQVEGPSPSAGEPSEWPDGGDDAEALRALGPIVRGYWALGEFDFCAAFSYNPEENILSAEYGPFDLEWEDGGSAAAAVSDGGNVYALTFLVPETLDGDGGILREECAYDAVLDVTDLHEGYIRFTRQQDETMTLYYVGASLDEVYSAYPAASGGGQ